MASSRNMNDSPAAAVADEVYTFLAAAFPVCCGSDEFYFFPQAAVKERSWRDWDDFSPERIGEICRSLGSTVEELRILEGGSADRGERIDAVLLRSAFQTLREQLEEAACHRSQPTMHLTVASIGLLEAMEAGDPGAWEERLEGLPGFLETALGVLDRVPALHREMGLEMTARFRQWFASLGNRGRLSGKVLEGIDRFEIALSEMSCIDSFLPPRRFLETVVGSHFGSRWSVDECLAEIDTEIAEMKGVLEEEVCRLAPGKGWQETAEGIPRERVPAGDSPAFYKAEVERLKAHCIEIGLVSPAFAGKAPLEVKALPPHLSAVRASDSYSARPGHPPLGGTFFIFDREAASDGFRHISPEYRMTSAHETWPGHHLLDLSRWNLSRAVRRPIEAPLYYEGWACLAEELLCRSGYFSGPWDRFIQARRRLRRALRGKADLELHRGTRDMEGAASLLTGSGLTIGEARRVVKTYTLRPGYQVCYTVGLRRFLSVLERFGDDFPAFAAAVMKEGEIGFDALGELLFPGDEDGNG